MGRGPVGFHSGFSSVQAADGAAPPEWGLGKVLLRGDESVTSFCSQSLSFWGFFNLKIL